MTPAVAPQTPALTALFAAYIAGSVGEAVMSSLDDLFLDADASAEERQAFARFYLDALEAGEADDAFPTAAEVPGILSAARA